MFHKFLNIFKKKDKDIPSSNRITVDNFFNYDKENPSEIRAVNLTKFYGKRKIIENISYSVKQGEVVGLLGPNGAGKTTSFYITVGFVTATNGNVYLNDIDITKLHMYQRAQLGIGYLPQEASIFRKLSVEDNLLSILEYNDALTQKDRMDITDRLLEEFNITHVRKQKGYTLSGGERRRCEIARALTVNPKFILLDEPFAGVDPIAVIDIQNIIASLKEKGLGILITDHNVRETLRITDRAYIMGNGKILVQGSPEEIIANPLARKIYLGESFSM
ncbi:ABC transporter ATP-binding protein [Brachyspira pilosicoli WesB]|uniref:ABC transporter ATP-binding protein n=2 Tax=Brachyspira pilosicoli TaxID=52584 RepID=K0JGV4_BRAPL|nr:LPS export ABC transporter ATP-binding protein [Brachyspira pilosicoli]MBW5377937.1 LPS export ABC transporter ATP-binding protein [Brachyspira pilosicoli]MBW5382904.1 LPS export ABC transporter ATP-binding protein [Brachyspira pilosicoli]MBW5392408.1 LPS export ABC transporter ATP-binding protein [Brachyspira pilosicoli]WIH84730.1 LPS export ABC transporter ATP-binding protein [Brachyspira pilosicoli]WIH86983.1 LPS export ABC transporter ATP-binding protein [Brachyspira pilosicoli]